MGLAFSFSGASLPVTEGTVDTTRRSGQALNSQSCSEERTLTFAGNYGTVFVKDLGTFNPFNYTIIASAGQLLATALAMYLLDAIGRRPIMMGGMFLQCTMMYVIGGLGTVKDKSKIHAADGGIVAAVVLFAFGYSIGWAAANWVTVSEISDQKLRDKNQASLLANGDDCADQK